MDSQTYRRAEDVHTLDRTWAVRQGDGDIVADAICSRCYINVYEYTQAQLADKRKELNRMADFKDIICDWKRMCDYYSQDDDSCCQACPITLAEKDCYAIYEVDDAAYFDEIESVVSKWAAEHPEPVYPTWWEYLRAYSITGANIPDSAVIYKLKNWEIPADIAEKLGIKPKEG